MVTTSWLADRLGDSALVVLDATWFLPGDLRDSRTAYAEGHLPRAIFFDIDALSDQTNPLPHMLVEPGAFATSARRLGVSLGSTVVVYDRLGLVSAPRVWWNFRVMGHGDVRVLDGGLPAWLKEGRPLECGWRTVAPGNFKSRFVGRLHRDFAAVRSALEDGSEQLVDARPAGRFSGAEPEPRPGLRSGHMPGARNLPWTRLVEDGRLLRADRLEAAFAEAGVDRSRPIVTTCGSGVTAATLALALARLGHDAVALYDGSWAEWGARGDAPIATGGA